MVTQDYTLPLTEIAQLYKLRSLAEHPFLQRLSREPFNPTAMWLFAVNHKEAITKDSVYWLSSLIARIDDDRIRSLITVQLNDELGKGDFACIHLTLLEKLIAGFEPWCPENMTEDLLAPGRDTAQRFERLYIKSEDPYEGIGALIAAEVLLEQIYQRLGHEIRRQQGVEPSALTWLTLHEGLESEHVEESLGIAQLVQNSDRKLEAAWRGAEEMYATLQDFLDGLYRICFS